MNQLYLDTSSVFLTLGMGNNILLPFCFRVMYTLTLSHNSISGELECFIPKDIRLGHEINDFILI